MGWENVTRATETICINPVVHWGGWSSNDIDRQYIPVHNRRNCYGL